jgi:hypothetical protein
MANLSDLIAQSTSDNPQKLVNLALATQMMGSGSGGSGSGLGGTNYIFVKGDGTPEENAIELQEAYDTAKTMPRYLGDLSAISSQTNYYKGQTFYFSSLSKWYLIHTDTPALYSGALVVPEYSQVITKEEAESVRSTVIVAPGQYKFGDNAFTVDTPYINIVSLTGNPDVILISDEIEALNETGVGVTVLADNVYLKGLNCGSNTFTIALNLDGLVCENCTGGDYAFGGYGGIASGTFINCTGGDGSFGTTASGTFTNCTGGYNSFGSGASGTFTNCTGGNNSFGSSTASGTFTNCTGGNNSFGSSTASGTFTNCTGGIGSFGGTISSAARLYYCRLTSDTFPTPVEGGKLVLCIDGNDTVVTTP